MNDKRESDKREPTSAAAEIVLPIVAELEAIDRKLAEHAAASRILDLGTIEKVRARVREAIGTLTPLAAEEMSEDAGSAKQRGKAKGSGKAPARGGRKPTPTEQAVAETPPPVPSLLARLGAVTQPAGEPIADDTTPPQSAQSAPSDKPMNTAERLAQLEAEIADLTEAVTASPSKSAGAAIRGAGAPIARPASGLVLPAARPGSLDLASDHDEDAEIAIIGAHGEPVGSRVRPGRNVPRILAEAPASTEEDAEVEIRGQDGARAGRPTFARADGRRDEDAGKGAGGRWRLFRGSR